MFGPDVLVAPVLELGSRSRSVYLPAGVSWRSVWTGEAFDGGRRIDVDAPLERIPVFLREGADVPIA
jgi:alpha-D-xyloside xylohydrolase